MSRIKCATALILFAVASCGISDPAWNKDAGQFGDVPDNVRAWFKSVKSPRGIPCCDIADGHRTEWRTQDNDGRYWVPIEGEWVPGAAGCRGLRCRQSVWRGCGLVREVWEWRDLCAVLRSRRWRVMRHLMLDLETWGTRAGCGVRSIGAVMFDRSQTGPEFYLNIGSCPTELTRDEATVTWWSRQSEAAQAAFLSPEPVPLDQAVVLFGDWFREKGAEFVWCHGATFDVPVWEAAANSVLRKVPWKYWNVRDTRTLYAVANFDPTEVTFAGAKHNALDDAKHQARCVQAACSRVHLCATA